jgi:hypothetical protein
VIAALLLCCLAQDASRATLSQWELSGPSRGFSLELANAGRAELRLERALLEGERRSLVLAVPLPIERLPQAVWSEALQAALPEGVRAKLLSVASAPSLDSVSAELMARPRPALRSTAPRLPWSALFVLGAAFSIALARRRQPWLATLIALLAAGSLLALTRQVSVRAQSAVHLLEARFDAPPGEAWLAVRAVLGRLDAAALGAARFEVDPRRSMLRCETSGDPARFELVAPGCTLIELAACDPGARRLTRAVNAWGNFERAWLREADGTWLALGAWRLGEALPSAVAGDPPGWLVPPLPMGRSLFLGQLSPGEGAFAFPQREPQVGGAGIWIRGLGL